MGNRYDADYQKYANISVGPYTRPCLVHENFKLIVHMPESSLHAVPRSFLSRFAKFRVSVSQALEQKLHALEWEMVCFSEFNWFR